jgi:hypothetical protein
MQFVPKEIGRGVTGFLVLVGSFAYFGMVSQGWLSTEWKDVVMMITGALISNVTTIVQWCFGSSKGSDKKTDALIEKINGT